MHTMNAMTNRLPLSDSIKIKNYKNSNKNNNGFSVQYKRNGLNPSCQYRSILHFAI